MSEDLKNMTPEVNPLPKECAAVAEQLAELLDGSLEEGLLLHVAECDRCRDLRFEMEEVARAVGGAAADYREPADFVARVLSAADALPLPSAAQEGASPISKTARIPASVAPPKATLTGVPSTEEQGEKLRRFLNGPKAPVVLGAALAVAAVLVLWIGGRGNGDGSPEQSAQLAAAGEEWSGAVTQVARGFGSQQGLSQCDERGERCEPLSEGANVESGAVLQTDGLTRAKLRLNDGTELVLDRATAFSLDADRPRRARLLRGDIVADVQHQAADQAVIEVPGGRVEVVGTKFAIHTDDSGTRVDVSRGEVRLVSEDGRDIPVASGQGGRLLRGAQPEVSPLAALGDSFLWSERAFASTAESETARGLGELRAKKPGEDAEQKNAVTLTRHAVKVRIQESMARTEVEEVFSNSTDDVLEGIFRFPLPADAQIERLALEVDGRLEEGAFVDRERAAAIWRGAIVNSSRRPQPVMDEIVWVPGPWKDPALLEWQAGGRFELRIFPIPKRGERRVILAYTQKLKPAGDLVRYTYPLAHDPSGSTRVRDFSVDVQVAGHQGDVFSRGYELKELANERDSGRARYALQARDFVPAGDVSLEFRLPDAGREVRAWAYGGTGSEEAARDVAAPSAAASSTAAPSAAAPSDGAYVAMAFRPRLPLTSNKEKRAFAFVIDRSRSMFGEQYRRAVEVVERTIRELDREALVTVLDCDSECSRYSNEFEPASEELANNVGRYLRAVQPEGASDLVAAVRAASVLRERTEGRELHIVYVGDGTPTVGEIQPSFLQAAVQKMLPSGVSISAITVGADADLSALGTLTRSAGGVLVRFAPGQSVAEVAFQILGSSYGRVLRDAQLKLPPGLSEVAPTELGTLAAGDELVVVARMQGERVNGAATLSGTVSGEPFERVYDLELVSTRSEGNAFVPRLFAAAQIAALEQQSSAQARERAVALSGRFNVASRYTSLLVLESPAMFKAFGLNNQRSAPLWTGESDGLATEAGGELAAADKRQSEDEFAEKDLSRDDGLSSLGSGSGRGFGPANEEAKREQRMSRSPSSDRAPAAAPPARSAPKAKKSAEGCACAPADLACAMRCSSTESSQDAWPGAEQPAPFAPSEPLEPITEAPPPPPLFTDEPPPDFRRRMVPMRKVWERFGRISAPPLTLAGGNEEALRRARERLDNNPLSRDAMKELYTIAMLADDLTLASDIAERWTEKDPLDPDALTARADVAAQRGDRKLAIRILGSVVDMRPGEHRAQWRLARLFRWAGEPARGCRHSFAAAQLRVTDAALLEQAVRCLRATGQDSSASALLAAANTATRSEAERALSKDGAETEGLSGDLRVEASWDGAEADLDLVILHPEGYRVSWLGAPTRSVISAVDVLSTGREGLALRGATPGDYAIEIVRTGRDRGIVRGELRVRVGDDTRTIPFELSGTRTRVATAVVQMRSRLVPL